MTPSMRHLNLSLYGWLGCNTLETYISQFHTWLTTGIPNGQPKMLLNFFPANYPLLNFAAATAGKLSSDYLKPLMSTCSLQATLCCSLQTTLCWSLQLQLLVSFPVISQKHCFNVL